MPGTFSLLSFSFCFVIGLFVVCLFVLGIELRPLYMLLRRYTSELHLQPSLPVFDQPMRRPSVSHSEGRHGLPLEGRDRQGELCAGDPSRAA